MAGRMSARAVAERLGVSERTVLRLAGHELRALRIGRRWTFDEADVAAFEAAHTAGLAASVAGADQPMAFVTPSGIGVKYEPVFRGPVPWRSEAIEASSAGSGNARGRTARDNTRKAPAARG